MVRVVGPLMYGQSNSVVIFCGFLRAATLVMLTVETVAMFAAHQGTNLLLLSLCIWQLYNRQFFIARLDIGVMDSRDRLLTMLDVVSVAMQVTDRVVGIVVALRRTAFCRSSLGRHRLATVLYLGQLTRSVLVV